MGDSSSRPPSPNAPCRPFHGRRYYAVHSLIQEQTGLQKLGQATAGVLSASILAMHGLMPPVAYGQELLLQTPPPKTAPAKPAIRLTPSELSTVQVFAPAQCLEKCARRLSFKHSMRF